MKELKNILKESIFDDDIDAISGIKDEIKNFIKDNYKCEKDFIISDKPNKNGLYEVSSNRNIIVKNENINSLTNNLFEWSEVDGDFNCAFCKDLKFLKGAPKIVKGGFYCYNCENLKSLEGAPKKIDKSFICSYCENLKSLEGAPEEINENFACFNCYGLKSLKGAPKKVGKDFHCKECKNLKSLEGVPKKVGRDFNCVGCGVKFTEDDVKAVSNVKGKIYC